MDMDRTQPQWLPPAAYQPAPDPARRRPSRSARACASSRRRSSSGSFALLKWGKALLLLLPKAKLLTTSASMLVSVGAYALIWGWRFAAGFVGAALHPRDGALHPAAARGRQAARACSSSRSSAPRSARARSAAARSPRRASGLAGPILGSLATAALIPIALATDDDFWYALAFTGFFLNLFNLLPVVPLDGGRAMAAMAPWMWFVGFGLMVLLVFVWPNPILLLIVLLGGFETYRRWKHRKDPVGGQRASTTASSPRTGCWSAGSTSALIVGLAVGMDLTHVERTFDDA